MTLTLRRYLLLAHYARTHRLTLPLWVWRLMRGRLA